MNSIEEFIEVEKNNAEVRKRIEKFHITGEFEFDSANSINFVIKPTGENQNG